MRLTRITRCDSDNEKIRGSIPRLGTSFAIISIVIAFERRGVLYYTCNTCFGDFTFVTLLEFLSENPLFDGSLLSGVLSQQLHCENYPIVRLDSLWDSWVLLCCSLL